MLSPSPPDVVYPVLFDIESDSVDDNQGAVTNEGFVRHTINLVKAMVNKNFDPQDIGIACPYHSQIELYRTYLRKEKMFIKVGTPEKFQESEMNFSIVDLVRGGNSNGKLGFLPNAKRLNFMLSRHQMGYLVVGDIRCIDVTSSFANTNFKNIDKAEKQKKENDAKQAKSNSKNKHIKNLFDTFREIGRVHHVAAEPIAALEEITTEVKAEGVDRGTGA